MGPSLEDAATVCAGGRLANYGCVPNARNMDPARGRRPTAAHKERAGRQSFDGKGFMPRPLVVVRIEISLRSSGKSATHPQPLSRSCVGVMAGAEAGPSPSPVFDCRPGP